MGLKYKYTDSYKKDNNQLADSRDCYLSGPEALK